jgi:hypothetical protein
MKGIKLKVNVNPDNMLLIVETFVKLAREKGVTLNVLTHKEGFYYGWIVHPRSIIVPCMWSEVPSHGFYIDLSDCLYTINPLLKVVVNKVPFFKKGMWRTKPQIDNEIWKHNVSHNLHRFKSTGGTTLAQ